MKNFFLKKEGINFNSYRANEERLKEKSELFAAKVELESKYERLMIQ